MTGTGGGRSSRRWTAFLTELSGVLVLLGYGFGVASTEVSVKSSDVVFRGERVIFV